MMDQTYYLGKGDIAYRILMGKILENGHLEDREGDRMVVIRLVELS
jgi:hypothetical protein